MQCCAGKAGDARPWWDISDLLSGPSKHASLDDDGDTMIARADFTKRMQEEAQREKDRQIALMKAEERKLMMENQMMKDALEKQGVTYTSPTSILPGALPTTKAPPAAVPTMTSPLDIRSGFAQPMVPTAKPEPPKPPSDAYAQNLPESAASLSKQLVAEEYYYDDPQAMPEYKYEKGQRASVTKAAVPTLAPTAAVAGRTERVTSLAEIGKLPDTKAPEGKEGGSVHYYEYGYYSYYTDDEEGAAPGSAPAARKTSTAKAPMPAGVTDVRTATKPSLTNMLSDRAVKVTMTEGSV